MIQSHITKNIKENRRKCCMGIWVRIWIFPDISQYTTHIFVPFRSVGLYYEGDSEWVPSEVSLPRVTLSNYRNDCVTNDTTAGRDRSKKS